MSRVPDSGVEDTEGTAKPYVSKRPHKKSRGGCKNCKTRKVKCDEARPTCKHCQLRKETCMYISLASHHQSKPASPSSSDMSQSSHRQVPVDERRFVQFGSQSSSPDWYPPGEYDDTAIVKEPMFTPRGTDETDMRLLWLYTTATWSSFSTNSGQFRAIDDILKVKIIQHAFQAPFLMDSILGLAALHLKHLTERGEAPVKVPMTKALAYRAHAFEGYRKAVESAQPDQYTAILAGSLILCALSSETLRDDNGKPLYIVDWMIVWRGIGLMIDMITPKEMYLTGIAPLFDRPPIDMNESALHIPSNLLFMVTSIKEGDPDFRYVEAYYQTLRTLGSLYKELKAGFGPVLNLRIIVWFTFVPKDFVEVARLYRPRALIILAYYLVFAKLVHQVWWMEDISNRELDNIWNVVGEEWHDLLRVPRSARYLDDRADVARLLLGNHTWEPVTTPPEPGNIGLVDDFGKEVIFAGRFLYKVPSRSRPTWYGKMEPEIDDPLDLANISESSDSPEINWP